MLWGGDMLVGCECENAKIEILRRKSAPQDDTILEGLLKWGPAVLHP